jgi:hypothetical protein
MGADGAGRAASRRGLVLALLLVTAAACGGGDGDDDDAGPTTSRAATTTGGWTAYLTLTSRAFADGDTVPPKFTCDGDNVPPPLDWTGVPAGTAELVLLVEDPDAARGTFTHWIVYRLPPADGHLEAGSLSVQAVEGEHDGSRVGYLGPCPPRGDPPHRYVFTLSAVDAHLDLPGGASADDVHDALDGHVVARGILTGTYER